MSNKHRVNSDKNIFLHVLASNDNQLHLYSVKTAILCLYSYVANDVLPYRQHSQQNISVSVSI